MITLLFQHIAQLTRPVYTADWLPEFMLTEWVQAACGIGLALILAIIVHYLLRNVVLKLFRKVVRRSSIRWDDMLIDNEVPDRLALLLPMILLRFTIELIPAISSEFELFLQRLVAACIILVVIRTLDAVLSAFHQFYMTLPMAEKRPIKSYVQLIKIFLYCIGFIFIIARLFGQSPWFFVSGLGAMMAIIMLIFKDTLLSLVASVQLTNNDLVRVGDWIEMPQFGADGDVIDIALNTVKVQNWDKTVTVIPTHKFLEHSFRNWRQMFEGGGRRIKRSIHINSSTIRFLTEEEIEKFSRFRLLEDYIRSKSLELQEHNSKNGADMSIRANARNLTNIGTLRAYIIAYLKSHSGLHRDLTMMVRQLEPTPEGIPLELYTFTSDTRWGQYEAIQADIFDHILAIVPDFGLKVYQRPSGYDVNALMEESAD